MAMDVTRQRKHALEIHEIAGEKYAFRLSWDAERPLHVDVRCAEAQDAWDSQGNHTIMYAKRGEPSNAPATADFAESQRLFGVAVKWDHCAHWEFGEEAFDENRREWSRGDGYIHTCGDRPTMFTAMELAYELAKKVLIQHETWDP